MLTLNARVTLAASIVLVGFLGLTGLALERAFGDAGLTAVRDRLQGQIYALLAAAEVDDQGRLLIPRAHPEARLSTVGSGLYARVADTAGNEAWRSPSLLGFDIAFPATQAPGVASFAAVTASDDTPLYALSFSVHWELNPSTSRELTFQVAETQAILAAQLSRFRRSLWGWLAAAAVALLVVQGLVLRFGLAPLRRVTREIAEIQSGHRRRLSGPQPRELRPLTENLNELIESGQARLERYRHTLAELAHSLKTPLAVIGSLLDGGGRDQDLRHGVREQTERMRRTVEYQLQRAAASGRTPLAPAVDIAPVANKLKESLLKVYADKGLRVDICVQAKDGFCGDEGDLMEILGNLLDNGCKWAAGRVRLLVAREPGGGEGPVLLLAVEDDGPGVPADKLDAIVARGVRADPDTPGHGIGLAVVHDLVSGIYAGELEVGTSDLGGARVAVRVPLMDARAIVGSPRNSRSAGRPP